jgi:predicted aldo/keto reductase-like oxidoreductase
MQIPIPDYFVLYNNVLENPGSDWTLQGNKRNYARLQDTGAGKASECLGCGLCEAACPQHINIPELMPKLAEVLED